ncbi:MAG TPA: DUF3365 domain-containing protein [Saprospiraceae bacterium]|nr:DUF3365 domain-containing protein [Saprospiraceae bacterium]
MKHILLLLTTVAFMISCSERKSHIDIAKIAVQADSLTIEAQKQLLKNLSQAISDSGFVYAIDYCNINASQILSSVSDTHQAVSIERLTDKNRNPSNHIAGIDDKAIFEQFYNNLKDTITIADDFVQYYKPIKILMPTCLKCHGASSDIPTEVLDRINLKYPKDLALGYKEGDLRGMWKVTLRK